MRDDRKPLFILLDTPVTAEPAALLAPLGAWGLTVWLAGPAQSWPKRLRLGLLMALTYSLADLFHFVGHILSSRYAGAPMDGIHLAAPLPRAVYVNNEVSPQTHRLRSVGGPLANVLACLLSFLFRPLTPTRSVWHEWLTMSGWFNGLAVIGSLSPLPFVDGGVILKWTLVEQGHSPGEAERVVRQANLATGGIAAGVGVILALQRRWLMAVGALLAALTTVAAGLGKLR